MKFDRILVPLDGSPWPRPRWTASGNWCAGRPRPWTCCGRPEAHVLLGIDPTDAQVRVVGEAEDYLATTAQRLREQGVKQVETTVWYGAPAESIVQAARVRKADLIIMSSHGRAGSAADPRQRGRVRPSIDGHPDLAPPRPGAPLVEPAGGRGLGRLPVAERSRGHAKSLLAEEIRRRLQAGRWADSSMCSTRWSPRPRMDDLGHPRRGGFDGPSTQRGRGRDPRPRLVRSTRKERAWPHPPILRPSDFLARSSAAFASRGRTWRRPTAPSCCSSTCWGRS